ncbi:large ribosomal subunit protein uL30z [Alnus glutinosa]|uniref:large ribosomal subunit protein uL30z n=1 Tax=Alnus glutinosa TaxID=3517 RepID=UPI002D792ABD|nr:large ribosomal subunit protein uL30z [Alnus glutinosa]XP_062153774.1 large ribosomal subunit protein uL30z [Alnus glutinosa]
MAEEEPKPLAYIPEIILKKRKSNEEWALKRKAQYEERNSLARKRAKHDFIRMPEDFIKEYRTRELDLVKMKQRTKRKRPALAMTESKLLFIVRIHGKREMHQKTRKVLYNLSLRKIFSGVFVKANEGIIEKLQKVEPYVTYGYPNLKNVKELIYKKGYAKIDKQRVPLTDNNIIEQALGKYGIICIEDIVHEIASVGPHFKEVAKFLYPFKLNKPEGGLQGTKTLYKQGGDTGNREDQINELISKMN